MLPLFDHMHKANTSHILWIYANFVIFTHLGSLSKEMSFYLCAPVLAMSCHPQRLVLTGCLFARAAGVQIDSIMQKVQTYLNVFQNAHMLPKRPRQTHKKPHGPPKRVKRAAFESQWAPKGRWTAVLKQNLNGEVSKSNNFSFDNR